MAIQSMDKKVVGVVLAGGAGRRMEGQVKPFAPFAGKRLIDHAVARLAPQVDQLLINLNASSRVEFPYPIIEDVEEGLRGPLAGVLAAFAWLKKNNVAVHWVATIPCDIPLLPTNFVSKLVDAMKRGNADCAYASYGGQGHYVCALWPMRSYDLIEKMLAEKKLAVRDGLALLEAIAVEFPKQDINPFTDVNDNIALQELEYVLVGKT